MNSRAKWSEFASLDGDRMLAAASRTLPAWISLLLVIIIAWQLARVIWSFIPAPAAGDVIDIPPGQRAAPGTTSMTADVRAIADAHLFGIARSAPEEAARPTVVEPENLRDTRLTDLSLSGTMAATPAEEAIAMIADSSGQQKIYLIGDTVSNGVTLHTVYADRVVLDENGVLTNLKLPDDFPEGAPAPTRRNTARATRATTQNAQTIQSVISQNVSALTDVIRPTPFIVNGQQQGFRVFPGRNRQQFAALGLRPGDLIKDIDGQALTDTATAMRIFEQMGQSEQVSVTVERNGQPEVIVLSTSQLDIKDENNR